MNDNDPDNAELDIRISKSPDHPHNWTVQRKQFWALWTLAAVGILIMFILSALDWRFIEDGREIRVASTPRFATNSSDAAIQYAEADGGLTRVMAYQAAESLKAGRLRIVLAPFEQPAMPIHLVYPTSRLLSAKVRTFIDLVTEMADWHFG